MKVTTDGHKASHGLSATAELHVTVQNDALPDGQLTALVR